MFTQLLPQIISGNIKALARAISLVENEVEGYYQFLQELPISTIPVIGITGPPGAGKSTLVDAYIEALVNQNKKVAVVCVDPSSPFNLGAVLGDRIRMSNWYNHPNVFIRSLATRGSLGGLHPKIIEIVDVIKVACFDYIIIETVGVGQSEIEIAGLANTTCVVLVPEAGDEVQTMKAGLMEIANLFVINKADRPDADIFVKNLRMMLAPAFNSQNNEIPILKTVALKKEGIEELVKSIEDQLKNGRINQKLFWLLTEKAFHIIQQHKMKGINKLELKDTIEHNYSQKGFNFYSFLKPYFN
jgi:LAO/AO transport system kinase